MTISDKIQLFNAAYKLALELLAEKKIDVPGLALKLNDGVRSQMKVSDDPAVIAEAAVNSIISF